MLLEFARQRGIPGGSAFRAIAGYGCHGHLHEQHFFELAVDVPALVEFIAAEFEADSLIAALHEEKYKRLRRIRGDRTASRRTLTRPPASLNSGNQ